MTVRIVYRRGVRSGGGVEIGTRRFRLHGFGPETCSLHGFGPTFRSTGTLPFPRDPRGSGGQEKTKKRPATDSETLTLGRAPFGVLVNQRDPEVVVWPSGFVEAWGTKAKQTHMFKNLLALPAARPTKTLSS